MACGALRVCAPGGGSSRIAAAWASARRWSQDFGRGGVAVEPTLDRALWTAEERASPGWTIRGVEVGAEGGGGHAPRRGKLVDAADVGLRRRCSAGDVSVNHCPANWNRFAASQARRRRFDPRESPQPVSPAGQLLAKGAPAGCQSCAVTWLVGPMLVEGCGPFCEGGPLRRCCVG